MLQTKQKFFGNYKQKFTLKTKRGITSSETIIANIFNDYFVNITKSLNIQHGILKILETILI